MTDLDVRAIAGDDQVAEAFPKVRHDFRVFVSEHAFDRATAQGAANLTREVGGILVGQVCRDEGGAFLRVDTTIDALFAEEKETELTFTHATWDHIHKVMDAEHPGQRIVGWYHTHPGFGIFLSDRDQFIQRSFFNLPYQIALVYDPKSHEHGVFSWHGGEPLRSRRYWIGEKEYTWDGSRAPAPGGARKTTREIAMETGAEATGAAAPQMDSYALGAGALVILLVGGLAGWWFGQSSARRIATEVQAELERARLAGAQEMVRNLNSELLGFVRGSVDGEVMGPRITQGLVFLDEGLATLEKTAAAAGQSHLERPVQLLKEGRRQIGTLRDSWAQATKTLDRVEAMSRLVALDPRKVEEVLGQHRTAVGHLYAEVAEDAAKAGDWPRAQRLFHVAAVIDPSNAPLYEKKRKTLEEELHR